MENRACCACITVKYDPIQNDDGTCTERWKCTCGKEFKKIDNISHTPNRYKDILTVGMKKGEWDFGVRATILELSPKEMDEFRAMIVVAIGTAEDMWRREQQSKHTAKSASVEKTNG